MFIVLYVSVLYSVWFFFFFSSRRRHTRCLSDWSSDVCSSDLRDWRFAVVGSVPLSDDWTVIGTLGRSIRQSSISNFVYNNRSEERRVGKECRSRWSPDQ